MADTLTKQQEREVACCCGLELQELSMPLELLPVAHDDACWLEGHSRFPPAPDLAALVATGCLEIEMRVAKSVQDHLTLHGKWEARIANALHAVMRRMRRDVKRRIVEFQSIESTRILPVGRWWRAAMLAVNPKLARATVEAGKDSLRQHNERRPRLRKQELSYDDSGDVLVNIPAQTKAGMVENISETMGKDYWLKWEADTRAMVWQTIQSGLDEHLSLMQIADKMDDAWAFDFQRAMLVSRTESTMALNAGHYAMERELIEDPRSAVNGREWLSILDGSTRPAHAEANGQTVTRLANGSWEVRQGDDLIGDGSTFIVGGERARYPGDPSLSAGNRINCRCVATSVFGGEVSEEDVEETRQVEETREIQTEQPPESEQAPPVVVQEPPAWSQVRTVEGDSGFTLSGDFRQTMQKELDSIPLGLRQRVLDKNGIEVVLSPVTSDVRPDLRDVQPRGWAADKTWNNVGGHFSPANRQIVVTERTVTGWEKTLNAAGTLDYKILDTDWLGQIQGPTLAHEFGHALDDAGKLRGGKLAHDYTNDKGFMEAYKKDVAGMAKAAASDITPIRTLATEDEVNLAYFLQAGDAGPEEAFAEATSHGLGKGNVFLYEAFHRRFPRVKKRVKAIMEQFT